MTRRSTDRQSARKRSAQRIVIGWLILLAMFLLLVLSRSRQKGIADMVMRAGADTAHAQATDVSDNKPDDGDNAESDKPSDGGGKAEADKPSGDNKPGDNYVPPGRILGRSIGMAQVTGTDDQAASAGGKDAQAESAPLKSAGIKSTGLKAAQSVGSTCTITPQESHSYGAWSTHRFKVVTGGHTYTGYCAQPSKPTTSGTYPVSELKNDTIKFLLMCAPGGPLFSKYGPGLYNEADNNMYAYAHAAISYAYCNDLTGLSPNMANGIKTIVDVARIRMKQENNPELMKKYTAYVAYNNTQDIVWLVETGPDVGYGRLIKKDAQPHLTKDNPLYSLGGATFGVYKDADCTDEVTTFTTGTDGTTGKEELEVGTYYVCETEVPPGYKLDETVHKMVIKENETTVLTVTDEPQFAMIDLVVSKVDRERALPEPLGGATLEGAHFLVEYHAAAQAGSISTRRWILTSDEDGTVTMDAEHKIEGDDFYRDRDGAIVLPLGTVVISEIRAPKGYLVNSKVITIALTDESGGTEEIEYEAPVIDDQVIRGDLEFNKIAERDQKRLGGIPFKITSLTTEESHTVVTDDNGYVCTASSWNPHSQNTNAGETHEDGVWFGGDVPVNDELGALPYDRYSVEEERCEANEGYELVSFEINISRNNVIVNGGTVSNKHGPEPEEPAIGTKAYDQETGEDEITPDTEVTIVDEVGYEGLEEGQTYTLVGFLMDKESGEPIIVGESVVSAERTFTAEAKEGSEKVNFTLDATTLEGKDTVVFEKLFNEAGEEIASHEDLKSEKQTVHFTKKKTPKEKTKKKLTTPGKKARTRRVRTGDLLDGFDWVMLALITAFAAASLLEVRLPKRA